MSPCQESTVPFDWCTIGAGSSLASKPNRRDCGWFRWLQWVLARGQSRGRRQIRQVLHHQVQWKVRLRVWRDILQLQGRDMFWDVFVVSHGGLYSFKSHGWYWGPAPTPRKGSLFGMESLMPPGGTVMLIFVECSIRNCQDANCGENSALMCLATTDCSSVAILFNRFHPRFGGFKCALFPIPV